MDGRQDPAGHGGGALARPRGQPAGGRATANLLRHNNFRRDVLYLQRTDSGGQALQQRRGDTEAKQLCAGR
jgi:hypothetical protein